MDYTYKPKVETNKTVKITVCPECGAAMVKVVEKQPRVNYIPVPDAAYWKCPECLKRLPVE